MLSSLVSLENFAFQSLMLGRFGVVPKPVLYLAVPILFLVISASAIAVGLVMTNRIAGPIFRLARHMEGVAEGVNPNEIAFRKSDFFSNLLSPYNKIIERLKKNPGDES